MSKKSGVRGLSVLASLALIALAAGCAKVEFVVAPEFVAPTKVAVLPAANEAVDTDGPAIFRRLITDKMIQKGYVVADAAQVDAVLLDKFDIENGGQLNAADPAELAEALQVDGLVYSTITEWEKHTAHVYNDIFVGGHFELVGKDGAKLWVVEPYKEGERQLNLDPKSSQAVSNTAAFLFRPYEPFAVRLIDKVFLTLPNR